MCTILLQQITLAGVVTIKAQGKSVQAITMSSLHLVAASVSAWDNERHLNKIRLRNEVDNVLGSLKDQNISLKFLSA